MVDLSNITIQDRALYLAYDQGLEHGPTDFNDNSIDPAFILDIAEKGGYNGIILQKGVAEKYYLGSRPAPTVPLILKLNGKTSLATGEPYSPLICTVAEAKGLGAAAVGYTVYVGSERQDEMFEQFGKVVREAHAAHLPVIGWMYPRGGAIEKETAEVTAYAARVGLELGADMVKVKFHDDGEQLRAIVQAAGRVKVVFSGGPKVSHEQFMHMTTMVAQSGGLGMAVGRNIWQARDPLRVTEQIKHILFTEALLDRNLRNLSQ